MSEIKTIKMDEVEKQVRGVMSLNRHERRRIGKINARQVGMKKPLKIPSDKNMNFVDGKLKEK